MLEAAFSSFCVVTVTVSDVLSAVDDVTIDSVDVTVCSDVTSSVVDVITGVVGGVIFPLVVATTDDVIIPLDDVIIVVRGSVVAFLASSVVGTPGVGSVIEHFIYLLNNIILFRFIYLKDEIKNFFFNCDE